MIKFWLHLFLPLLVLVGCGGSADSPRPNIVFIFSDDHTRQAIGAYGGPLAALDPTPNIDRLATEGMRFDRFYVENSICAPSRAALLTGKFSHLHGKRDNHGQFNHDQPTFPKLLQSAGYQTAIVGKTHLAGIIQGFDYWEVLPGQGSYYQPEFITAEGRAVETGYVADLITDKALKWLREQRDPEQPFLLMVHHKGTHRTWCPALRHLEAFDGIDLPEPPTLFDDYQTRGTAARRQDMTIRDTMNLKDDLKVKSADYRESKDRELAGRDKLPPGEWGAYFRMTEEQRKIWDAFYDPRNEAFFEANLQGDELVRWKYQRYVKDYLRSALSIDESVGRILDALAESGLDQNTIVFYSSDQGFYLGEHGWFDKRFMYEESFSTPLLVRWPGKIAPGSQNSDLGQNIDFAPTFLDLAGVDIPDDMQGQSLVPLLEGDTPNDWRNALYYHYYEFGKHAAHHVHPHEGVATQRYKLIRFYGGEIPGGEEWEWYDLQEDPQEMNNRYGNPEFQDTINDMKQRLTELREAYGVN
jgi:arylsulfatase A-like enzyme